jgi:L-lysine epsilon oxidase-like protein
MSAVVYEIYPAIGIARVGNAPESFYLGPERAGGLPIPPDAATRAFGASDFRDSEGRLRRQAARFRIWRYATGAEPVEVTLDTEDVREIRWTVHLANKKASWYRFLTSKGQHGYGPNHPLRNAELQSPDDRWRLIIDPGPRSITGRTAAPVDFSAATIPPGYRWGNFPPATLKPHAIETLGTLRTDSSGRLLVLGGFGHSGSLHEPPALTDYANNDGWWDDVSDGPVWATVRLATGEVIEAKPAWALVAPPAYAPQIGNLSRSTTRYSIPPYAIFALDLISMRMVFGSLAPRAIALGSKRRSSRFLSAEAATAGLSRFRRRRILSTMRNLPIGAQASTRSASSFPTSCAGRVRKTPSRAMSPPSA